MGFHGCFVGAAGRFVGTTVGRFVGTAVGRMFGATDGITLGLAVGVFVGELVGVALGVGNKEAPSTRLSVEYPIFVRSIVHKEQERLLRRSLVRMQRLMRTLPHWLKP